MVRKIARTATAALVMTSLFGMTAFASDTWNVDGAETTMTGDSYAVEPTIEVELPGDLAFGINPLKLAAGEDGTVKDQIVSGQYLVTNYSNVPVLITASTKAEGKNDATLMSAPTFETNNDLTHTDGKKNIWLVQMYPQTVTISADGAIKLEQTALKNDGSDSESNVAGNTLGTTEVEALFMLDAYSEEAGLKDASVSGFTFTGAVDPNASFAEADVTVTTKFKLNTLSENQKTKDYEGLDLNSGTYHATVVQKKAAATP